MIPIDKLIVGFGGVAVIVINTISSLSSNGATTLLAFGIAALGIASLQK